MVEQYDRRFVDVAHLFREWRPRGESRATSTVFELSRADGQPTATAPAEPKPHEMVAPDADGLTVAEQFSEHWATDLATRVAARDPETLRDLDLPAHDRAVAEALRAIGAALPAGERHRLRELVDALNARESNLINQVGYMGWDAGYATAVEAYTGGPPLSPRDAIAED
jgi:gamma-glutamylcysteine synthetase